MIEVLKQGTGNSKKAMTEFLAFPFKTPSTVAGIYVFEFWFPEQWGILSEILFCQFNQSYSKTCYRNPELSSTFSNPISFEVEILLANSQCTEIPWPLMHLCFQRPTEAEGIDLEYRVKNIKFSWTLISLTNAPFFFTQWCISEAHFVWSLQRHQMIFLCHSVNSKCRINKPLWPNTHSFPQNIFVTHNGQACKFLPNFQWQSYN